jgi:hypothetical protein
MEETTSTWGGGGVAAKLLNMQTGTVGPSARALGF